MRNWNDEIMKKKGKREESRENARRNVFSFSRGDFERADDVSRIKRRYKNDLNYDVIMEKIDYHRKDTTF